jgi:hypothetical protein
MRKKSHSTSKLHIRKGDTVKVLSGNYRNKQGMVLKIFTEAYLCKKSTRGNREKRSPYSYQQPHAGRSCYRRRYADRQKA